MSFFDGYRVGRRKPVPRKGEEQHKGDAANAKKHDQQYLSQSQPEDDSSSSKLADENTASDVTSSDELDIA